MFFKKHKQLPEECTESERKCLNEFLNRLNYFTCPNCDSKIYSVEKYCKCSKCGRKMLIIPTPKEHKSSKDAPPAKTQRIEPPMPQPPHTTTYIPPDKDERVFNSEPPKDSNSITNTPVKLGKTLETIQTGSNSEALIAAMELLKMCEEREKEWEKEGKQMENEPLKNIKKLVIPNHVFTVGEIAYETSNEKPIKEIKPWYTANIILYNLIGDNGELLASIQANDAIILY